MSTIALDYDGTFTEDPELWRGFVKLAKERGHEVLFVTSRDQVAMDAVETAARSMGIESLACNGLPKIGVADENGIIVNIWIDDMPGMLFKNVEY